MSRTFRVLWNRRVGHEGSTSEVPRCLTISKAATARRMHLNGESVSTIADALGVSRATVYRVLAEEAGSSDTSP
jgi:DNA invertase Pin-like site-specific DNA recombinase